MRNTIERRRLILEYLLEHRSANRATLSEQFGVCMRTIERDILILSCSHPIMTTQGGSGGITIAHGYRLGMKYMNDQQVSLLTKRRVRFRIDIIPDFALPIFIASHRDC